MERVVVITDSSPSVSEVGSDLTNSASGSTSVSEINEIVSAVSATERGGTLKRNELARNEIWQFFRLYNEKQFSKAAAHCILCSKDVHYGTSHSTSNLEKHVMRHHKDEYKTVMNERAEKKQRNDSTGNFGQRKLSDYLSVTNCPNFEDALLNWIVQTYQPLSVIEHPSFREMLLKLNNKSPLISHAKIHSLLSAKYYDVMASMKKILKMNQISLTTDAWTSITKDGYVTCTIHFIEPNSWTLHCFSLGIFKKDGASTAIDVVRYAEAVLETFEVTYDQLTCVVTDTEATMVAAGRLFKENSYEAGGTTSWHGCIDHMLELITKLAFKDLPNSSGAMSACRSLVNLFNSSSQASSKLKDKSKAMLGVALTVIQDVCTRWWSTYMMCERMLRLKSVLTVLHLEGDIRVSLSEAQWAVIQDLTLLLKPFMVAQKLLEGESYVTISLIPFMLYKIRNGLIQANQAPSSSPQVREISGLMLTKFVEQFGSGEAGTVATDHQVEGVRRRSRGIPKIVLMSLFLDPRTKSAIGVPLPDQELIWNYIETDLIALAISIGPPSNTRAAAERATSEAERPPNRRLHQNQYAQDVDNFLAELDDAESDDDLRELDDCNDCNLDGTALIGNQGNWTEHAAAEVVRREIVKYKLASCIKIRNTATGKFNCPLDWWRAHHSEYFYLSKLALKYLAIPATSAPSERVFSAAGLTIAKDRARLDPDRANELVFLHDCIPALKRYNEFVRR
jgi:hypothetical protein